LHQFIKFNFVKKNIFINDVKFCPYHPKAAIKKFKKNSSFRKPNNSMVKEVFKNWSIDIKKSLMIGDKKIDEECAKKSKLKFIYYNENIVSKIKQAIKSN
jgi:D-glycero-D-manno-heptose 1,7-bisphosphate phosphatase